MLYESTDGFIPTSEERNNPGSYSGGSENNPNISQFSIEVGWSSMLVG